MIFKKYIYFEFQKEHRALIYVMEVNYSVGGFASFLKYVLRSLKGKCVFKLGVMALLFSGVNREEGGSEIQLLLE